MTSMDLDREMRAIFERARPHTILADTRALMALGFTPWSSFSMLEKAIVARSGQPQSQRVHEWKRCHPNIDGECWYDNKTR